MGSLERFQSVVLGRNCIILCISGKILCGCGRSFVSLLHLQDHVQAAHDAEKGPDIGLGDLFSTNFVFPQQCDLKKEVDLKNEPEDEIESVIVDLPKDVICVCLNEHDIGSYSGNVQCYLCNEDCDNLELLNKHVSEIHKVGQVLVGQNILFERPVMKSCQKTDCRFAFFCPMLKCKYHIAESKQTNFFKTFKLLKQHYVKVHAVKLEACEGCGQKFGSSTYLELHKKTCGQSFSCTACGLSFPALESLQTHARRKGHPFPSSNPPKKSRKSWQVSPDVHGKLPTLAPRPSALHMQAAIALSELGERRVTPKADIGIQTDVPQPSSRQSRTSSSCSPAKTRWKVSAETQTKDRLGKRRCPTVSSQVRTPNFLGNLNDIAACVVYCIGTIIRKCPILTLSQVTNAIIKKSGLHSGNARISEHRVLA